MGRDSALTQAPVKLRHRAPGTGILFALPFSPGRQRGRQRPSTFNWHEQDSYIDAQPLCQGFERGDRNIFRATFDTADIRAIDASLKRQPLLTKSVGHAQAADIPADCLTHIHAPIRTAWRLDNRRTDSPLFHQNSEDTGGKANFRYPPAHSTEEHREQNSAENAQLRTCEGSGRARLPLRTISTCSCWQCPYEGAREAR